MGTVIAILKTGWVRIVGLVVKYPRTSLQVVQAIIFALLLTVVYSYAKTKACNAMVRYCGIEEPVTDPAEPVEPVDYEDDRSILKCMMDTLSERQKKECFR